MRLRKPIYLLLVIGLLAIGGAAGAWDAGTQYTLHSSGLDPNFSIQRSITWPNHASTNEWLGVLNIEVWQLGKYGQNTQYRLGSIKTLCVDLDHIVYVPDTWNATYRMGIGGVDKPYALTTTTDQTSAWSRLTYAISHNGEWFSSGTAEEKAAMQLAVWELINGDSAFGADSNWTTSGAFKVRSSGSTDPVLQAAAGYLDSTRNVGGWSGADFGWWSSQEKQDQIIVPVTPIPQTPAQAVPEAGTLAGFGAALALNGFGAVGARHYLRRRHSKAVIRKHVGKCAMYMDMTVSMMVLLLASPILLAVAAQGALRSGRPVTFD